MIVQATVGVFQSGVLPAAGGITDMITSAGGNSDGPSFVALFLQASPTVKFVMSGLILASVAAFLSIEIKSLLIGEAASEDLQKNVHTLLTTEGGKTGPVRAINEIRTMQLGPNDVIVAASVDMEDTATAADVEAANDRLNHAIKKRHPEVRYLFIDVKSASSATKPESSASLEQAKSDPINRSKGAPDPKQEASNTSGATQATITPVSASQKPTIAARPASARKGKGGKRRR